MATTETEAEFPASGMTATMKPHRPKPVPQPWYLVEIGTDTVAAFATCKDAVRYAGELENASVRPVDFNVSKT